MWPTTSSWDRYSSPATLRSSTARATAPPTWNGTSPTRPLPSSGWDLSPSSLPRPPSCCSKSAASSVSPIQSRSICPVLPRRGIPDSTSFRDYAKLNPFAPTPEQLVSRFRDKPLDFEPGEKWQYSNSGYLLLSYLIEKITGENYEKFVRENIFTPLAMKDSGYDSNSAVIPHRASGYVLGKNGFENAGFIHMSVPQGAGALYSTTGDLLK